MAAHVAQGTDPLSQNGYGAKRELIFVALFRIKVGIIFAPPASRALSMSCCASPHPISSGEGSAHGDVARCRGWWALTVTAHYYNLVSDGPAMRMSLTKTSTHTPTRIAVPHR
eukprot:6456433-Amphidinium_carterae.1